jgi:glycosyltransferase involved in cell wall biosynthesis
MSENLLKEKPKQIALFMIAPLTQGGGAEKYFINLAQNLSRNEDMDVDVITFDDKSFRGFARLLHIFARGNFFGKITDYEKGMREKREDIKSNLGAAHWRELPKKEIGTRLKSYDLIYAKNEIADLFLLKMIGYKKLPPIVVGVHTPITYPETKSLVTKIHNFLYSGFFYQWLLKDAKCIHVSNQAAKDIIEKKFSLSSKLIYYPFPVAKINDLKETEKCSLQFEEGKINIIFAARLSEQKGIDVLIKLIEKMGGQDYAVDRISLNIFGIGDKKYERALEIMSKKYSFVHCFGHVANKYMPHIFNQQNLMIAPSRWETLPFSVLEAQSIGLPVVAFDIPGPADIIQDKLTGILAKNDDEFVRVIHDFVDGRVRFDRNEIIANIERKFNPEKIYSELNTLFRKSL